MSDDTPLYETPTSSVSTDRTLPTTVTVSTDPPRPRRSILNALQSDPRTQKAVDNAIRIMFDAADNVADEIASLLRLRRTRRIPQILPLQVRCPGPFLGKDAIQQADDLRERFGRGRDRRG